MSQYFAEHGAELFSVGIEVIPIVPRKKFPAIEGWQSMEITEEDGQTYYYVHWIDVTADGEEAGNIIKGTMEKWLRRIWK